MKKGFYKILIVLMSIALIGLIIIQIYWLKITFRSSLDNFNGRVFDAMNASVDKISRNELNTYYTEFEKVQKDVARTKDKPQVISTSMIKDSLGATYIYYTRYIMEHQAIPLSGNYTDSLQSAQLYSQEGVMKIPKDSGVRGLEKLNINFEKTFKNATYSIERLARLDAGNKPIDKRVKLKLIDSVFNAELKQRGIMSHPQFAVVDKTSKLTPVSTKEFNLSEKEFSVPLFYDKDDRPSYYLVSYLPDRNLAIFAPVVPIVGLTVLFTLIIITVFSLAIYYMQLQRKISEVKTDFINNMTHEFKTPIATINIASDALKNEKVINDPEKIKYYAGLIKQENKRMNNQVEMVLRMSKLERNQMDLNLDKVHLNDLVKKAVSPISFIVKERNGTIFEDYQATEDDFNGDPFHLENIFINILDNARKYSPDKPVIAIRTYNKEGSFYIEIKDHGIGMSNNVLQKIFDQFYREETGNVHNVKGHGLGLSYVKKIVELHKGEVWAESEIGKGSTFYIKLPLKD